MEKGLLKASGIVAIIVGIGWCLSIIGIIVGIPLIIGGSTVLGYAKLSDEEILDKKSSILGWSIFFIFFTIIAGILGLAFYFITEKGITINKTPEYLDEIKKLEELRKNGLITEKEFEAKKKKILDI